uniref:Uncharacterized protein n=1 Tax=Cacopsylla melanoneura TaxID=428564 RepID=A0A8D9BHY2_9HEMI
MCLVYFVSCNYGHHCCHFTSLALQTSQIYLLCFKSYNRFYTSYARRHLVQNYLCGTELHGTEISSNCAINFILLKSSKAQTKFILYFVLRKFWTTNVMASPIILIYKNVYLPKFSYN